MGIEEQFPGVSTMYINFDRSKTRLETVLNALLVCKSSEVYCLWLYLKDGVLTLDQFFAPFRTRSIGQGDNWCFCLVVIVIDLVLIGLMTI